MSSTGFVQAVTDPEGRPPLRLRTGVVRTVDTSSTPYTVELDLAGVTVGGVTWIAGHDLEVGSVVQVLQQGSQIVVLGPLAPARMIVGAHNHTTPPTNPTSPPPPGTAPTAPTAVRKVSVTPDASSSWVPAYSNWRTDGVYQGGGSAQRGFWFYGGKIAAAKGSGTITAASVFVKRASSGGVGGSQTANVRLGTHTYGSQPATGGTAHGNVSTIGALTHNQGASLALTAAQVAALNAGAVGVGLEPGTLGYTTADYFIGVPFGSGTEWSGVLELTVEG